jgi:hypothetical protein
MSKHNEYILIDGVCMTVAAFDAMPKAGVKRINASGCTSLTEIHAPNVEYIDVSGCIALTELHAPKAEYINASGCAALTEINAPKAEYINATGCVSLTEVNASDAREVIAGGCVSLTKLNAPDAKYIHASGCTSLTDVIHGGKDSRGYHFFGLQQRGKYRIFAGCRNFTLEEALAHWGPGGPGDKPDCLALVEKIIAEIKTREKA